MGAQLVTSGDRGCPQRVHTTPGEQGPGGDRDRRGDRNAEGTEQERGAGPRPFLCPPCLGTVPHPWAPTSTRSLCHRRVVSGTRGGQGKGTASSPGRTGPPRAPQPQAWEGTPMGRCGGAALCPHPGWGAGVGSPHPILAELPPTEPRCPGGSWEGAGSEGGAEAYSGVQRGAVGCRGAQRARPSPGRACRGSCWAAESGERGRTRPRALAQGAGAAALSRIPRRPLDPAPPAPAGRATTGHRRPPRATGSPARGHGPLRSMGLRLVTAQGPLCGDTPMVPESLVGSLDPPSSAEGAQARLSLEAL